MKAPPPPNPHHIGTTNQAPHQKEKRVKEEIFLEVGRVGWSYFNLFGMHLGTK
jgi:hypothetical protein